jgi:multisubunit Na+/H+ antiporter MnhB subunit
MGSLILKTATRLLVGLILVFSVYLLLRGHNAPGGGFSAALVAGTGFALFIIAEGPGAVRRTLVIDPIAVIAAGILLALAAGLPAVFQGKPFLTGLWWPPDADLAALHFGTPLVFDVGVFLVVLGTVVTLIVHLEED